MGANVSGDDFEADDKEVFQSYRIPPKAYKKKNSPVSTNTAAMKSVGDTSAPASPGSVEFGAVPFRDGGEQRYQFQDHQRYRQQRYRAGSLSSALVKSRRERPISHPPSVLSNRSSTSSLNLSIVNAAVAAGSPAPSIYPYTNNIVSAPLPMIINGAGVGSGGSVGTASRTNSGYSESFDLAHSLGSGLGRATFVHGKVVEMGFHGSSQLPTSPLYMQSNYTVQDFISYQQQQQHHFLEQQQLEYQQMLLLQQQQQQLRQQYQQQQLLLQQQQQQLQQQQHGSSSSNPSQDLVSPHITGVILQTKTRRPARHPDRVSNNNGNNHNRAISQSIAIPATPSSSSLERQPHIPMTPTSARLHSHRSLTHSDSQPQSYGSSPPGSFGSSYTGAGSSFSSTGSQCHNMLAMTAASPPSSSSSSLSGENGGSAQHHHNGSYSTNNQASTTAPTSPKLSKFGHSIDDLAAKILPPRRLLGGREYHPDKTLPYLLPCDEQEGERLLLQHYVIRYAFGSNVIPPISISVEGKVLDCGCGPGTWVMELATEYEDLDFYGFDVSPMYPSAIHPRNAHFSTGNILDPEIPFATESFVLVHQRNMLLGLTQDAWPGVVQDLYRCVVSGGQGWLQLSEVDPIWSRPGPVSRSFLKMLNETAQNRNVDVMLPQRLDQALRDAGCGNVKVKMAEIPIGPWGGKIGLLWRDVLKAEIEALKPVVLQAALENAVARGQDIAVCGAEMTTSEEWDEMMAQVWGEMDQYHTFSRVYVAYGQKP